MKRSSEPISDEVLLPIVCETALSSEATLAEDWNRPEEDAAWFHLQPEGKSAADVSYEGKRND